MTDVSFPLFSDMKSIRRMFRKLKKEAPGIYSGVSFRWWVRGLEFSHLAQPKGKLAKVAGR